MDRYFVIVPKEEQRKDPKWWLAHLIVWKQSLAEWYEAGPTSASVCAIPCATEETALNLAHAIRNAAAEELELRAKEIRAIQCVVSGK